MVKDSDIEVDPATYGIDHIDTWVQQQFRIQMEHWLEFACNNIPNPKYRYPQTERPACVTTSSPEGRMKQLGAVRFTNALDPKRTPNRKPGENKWFNTWLLFKDWRKQIRVEAGPPGTHFRLFVHYTDAVPELHMLLDYIESQEKLEEDYSQHRGQ